MSSRFFAPLIFSLLLTTPGVSADAPLLPPGEKEPLFRLEAEGPTSFVTALAFSPDGSTLYAAGWDKVVRVWNLDPRTGRFVLDRAAYRVPLGPGIAGAINAIAVSADGAWLAVGGKGVFREGAGFRELGVVLPKLSVSEAMREDEGTIYLFNTKTRAVRLLRGHQGSVVALVFAPSWPDKPPLLASVAREWIPGETSSYAGVVRLWNVTEGTLVGRLPRNLPFRQARPGLTVQHTGNELKQVQVALVWMDGQLRVWNVERGELRETVQGRDNGVLAALPTPAQLLAGGTDKLQVWQVPPTAEPRPEAGRQIAFPGGKGVAFVPVALTLLSGQANGKLDHAAVILRRLRGQDQDDWLSVVDLNPGNFGAVRAQVALGPSGTQQPVVAAAPGGRYVVVAGNPDHEIAVFAIADLLRNRAQPQKLRSTGATIHEVAFIQKGQDLGLLLNERMRRALENPPRAPAAGDLIFDFRQGSLSANRTGWQTSAPPLEGWRVGATVTPDKKTNQISIFRAKQPVGTIHLGPTQVITQYALLPPGPFSVPILALALYEQGEPLLILYNAASGEPIRQLTGHANYIRSLAFAGDGKLLASAGEDQTVCLWSLADLDQHLGQHGLLRGVPVGEKGGVLIVGQLDAAQLAKNRAQLQEGDLVLGLEEGNQTPLTSTRAFYDAMAVHKPGKTVTLLLQNSQGQRRAATLEVGQGVDERKPLLSVFLTRGDKPEERDWLGWNPLGFYESSSPRADRHFGWHFNTGEPNAPTSFAGAEEYRKDHYREGLLKHLVAQRNLGPALKAWENEFRRQPLPAPEMSLWLEDAGTPAKQADAQGRLLVRHPALTLKLAIDNFPLDKVDKVEWQFDEAAGRKFDQVNGRDWSADLARLAWTRGDHRLRVLLRSLEEDPHTYVQELTLHYQPKPPTILCAAPVQQVVTKPEFPLEARVQPGSAGGEMRAHLYHRHQGKELLSEELVPQPRQELELKKQFKLEKGENLLELVAVNKDAPAATAERETDRLTLLVVYNPPQEVPPPTITLQKVRFETEEAGETTEQAIKPGQPIVVHTPKVRVVGQITAKDKLTRVFWVRNQAKKANQLRGWDPQKNVLDIAEDLSLEPGPQTLQFLAKSATSPEAKAELTLEYRPLLPLIVLTPLEPVLYEGQHKPIVQLQGHLIQPRDRRPFTAVVLINGQQRQPILDPRNQTLTATLPLQPGDNRLQVRLSNAWQMTSASEEIHVRYARPPRITTWEGKAESTAPLIDLVAQVDSASALLPEAVQAEVNGSPITTAQVLPPDKAPAAQTWRVQLKDVALDQGKNEVRLFVRNTDARCREPGVFTVTYTPVRPPPRPEVEILHPRVDTKMTDPDLKVRFRFRSAKPPRTVELLREGRAPLRQVIDVAKLQADAQGWYETEAAVVLVPKENLLRVQVTNEGGGRSAEVTVNYVQMPVRLAIDRLVPRGPQDAPLVPEVGPNGTLTFARAPQGRLWLEGRVIWDQEEDEQLGQANDVHVYVNGFPQLPGELKPAETKQRERRFRAPLVLNRQEGNRIEIVLPALKQECANRRDFTVDCARPVAGQRLHVLIISAGEKDEEKLKERVLQAVKTPAFDKVLVHSCLTGYVDSRMIFTRLHDLQDRIQSMKRSDDSRLGADAYNDVVLVYFQGAEAINAQGHFFLTNTAQAAPQQRHAAVACESLTSRLMEILAAQVLLLDVSRSPLAVKVEGAPAVKDELEHCTEDFRVGILRSALPGQAHLPNQALLLSTWEEGKDQNSRLKDLVSYIEARYKEKVVPSFPGLLYKEHVPPMLADLQVGHKKP